MRTPFIPAVFALLLASGAGAVEPLVVMDAATVDFETARQAIAEIDAGRPAVVVGGPLLCDRRVDWNGEWLPLSAARARMDALPAGHVLLGGDRGFDLKGFEHHMGWLTAKGGSLAPDPDGRSIAIRTGGPLKQWDLHYQRARPYAEGDDLLVLEARSEADGAQLQLELNDGKGGRWFATIPLGRDWRHVVLSAGDFVGKAELKPREIVRYSFGVSEQYTPRMSGRAGAFHIRLFGSTRNPVPGLATGALAFSALPAVEGVWPEYKTYVKDGRVCYLDRPTGEGFGRNNVWRMKRLANAAEAILLERRPGRPERAVALFGYRRAEELADPDVKARMARAKATLASGALLFEAGTREFSYLPGETVTLGASWRGTPKSLEFAVTDRAGAVQMRRVFGPDLLRDGRVSFTWTPPARPAVYRVKAVLDGDDAVEHDFAVVRTEPDAAEDFVAVRDGDFLLHGRPWYPVCINFWPNYSAGTEKADYWDRWMADGWYSPNLVKKDVANFVKCGGNALSIQASRAAGPRNLRDVLRICREAGVRVNLFLHCANPLAFNAEMRDELAAFLRETGVAGDATVFAFDTIWEPGNYVFNGKRRGALDLAWQRWTEEQYGSVAHAVQCWGVDPGRDAKGFLKSPPDAAFTGAQDAAWRKAMAAYRRFMDNYTARRWNVLKRTLRGLAPRQLQSFRQGNTLPHDFALNGPVRHLDFVMPEGYQFGNTDDGEASIGWVTRYVDAYSRGKPVVWSEFGRNAWDGPSRATDPDRLADCAAYSERFYRAGLFGGANGFSPWWFPGGYRFDERSDFGIMGPDDVPRAPLQVLARYAPEILKPRAKPVPSVWMDFDRDASGGGYYDAALHAGRDAFAAARAQGRVLGVRLAGTAFTSADCPAVALGDVPLEGRMPAKYLDADFDVFETRRGEDGSLRLRAQLGNPGPAAWTAGDGAGAVRLVVRVEGTGRIVAEQALTRAVPRFGESEMLACAVPAAEIRGRLCVRAEAKERFPFGELRIVEVK